MTKGNAKLSISFEFDITLPESLLGTPRDQLLAQLRHALGATVFEGMPTVSRKQLGKAGITLDGHTSQCDVAVTQIAVPVELVARAAPHLRDDELSEVARAAAAKLPQKPAERMAHIRRIALKHANDYRLVACRLTPEQSVGGRVEIHAQLNLTNGGVIVEDEFKKIKLKSDQGPITIQIDETDVTLEAKLGGHTLGGPLLEVDINAIATHRDALMARWQAVHA